MRNVSPTHKTVRRVSISKAGTMTQVFFTGPCGDAWMSHWKEAKGWSVTCRHPGHTDGVSCGHDLKKADAVAACSDFCASGRL